MSLRKYAGVLTTFGLAGALMLAYGGGVHNQPVAEDFLPSRAFLHLGPGLQFRPTFALPILLFERWSGFVWQTPTVFHVYVLLLHLCASLALALLCRKLGLSLVASFLAGVIFELYPRHHEPVLWTAGSAHLVMTLFWLLSLIGYVNWRTTKAPGSRAAAIVLFTLALFASEAGVAALAVLIAFHIFIDAPRTRSPYAYAYEIGRGIYPFFFITACYVLMIVLWSGHPHLISGRNDMTWYHLTLASQQITNGFGYVSYGLLPFVQLHSLDATGKLLMALASLMFLLVLVWFGDRRTYFGLTWFVAALAPYVLLVPYGNADRYFYPASAALCLTVATLLDRLLETDLMVFGGRTRVPGSAIVSSLVVAYVVAAVLTAHARIAEWRLAGETVRNMFTQLYGLYPVVEPDARFYFVNVPKRIGSAMCMGVGMQWALRIHYGSDRIVASGGEGQDLLDALRSADNGQRRVPGVIVMAYENGRLLDRSSSYREPETQTLLALNANEPR